MSRQTRKYQALVAPLPRPGEIASDRGTWLASWRGVVRAADHDSRAGEFLTALITTSDAAERPTGRLVTVTMVLVGAGGDLDVGDGFTLWQGTDIARGVVTRRLFV